MNRSRATLILVLAVCATAFAGCADEGEGKVNAAGWKEFEIKLSDGRKVPCVSNDYPTSSQSYAFNCDWANAKRTSGEETQPQSGSQTTSTSAMASTKADILARIIEQSAQPGSQVTF